MGASAAVPRTLIGPTDAEVQDHLSSLVASYPERAIRLLK